jgi:hypothetical protein
VVIDPKSFVVDEEGTQTLRKKLKQKKQHDSGT